MTIIYNVLDLYIGPVIGIQMLQPYFSTPVLQLRTKKPNSSRKGCVERIRNTIIKRPCRETGERVRINVSGKLFETYMKTLVSKKTSIFNSERIAKYYDGTNGEFYFDRDGKSFNAILVYMQCGVLNKPDGIALKIFTEELKFFGFHNQASKLLSADSNVSVTCRFESLKLIGARKYIWQLLENHNVNVFSQILSAFCTMVTILWISLICLTTVPAFHLNKDRYRKVEMFCISWFACEIFTRLLFSPSKWKFYNDWLNIVDIISLLPFFIATSTLGKGRSYIIKLVRLVGITRIIRAFRVYKNSKVIRVITLSATSSYNELLLVGFFISIQTILFASAIFYFEHKEESVTNEFLSIPHVFWFCVVTITTVGYGDMVPITVGK